jgi:hypothetical protein
VKNYRLRSDVCVNCRHCYVQVTHDSGGVLYCTHEAPPRPPDPECWREWKPKGWTTQAEELAAMYQVREGWWTWSRDRRVEPHGMCDAHEATGKG